MGFLSPAQDHIEQLINLNHILMSNPANMFRIETSVGFVLVDRTSRLNPGDKVASSLRITRDWVKRSRPETLLKAARRSTSREWNV